MTLQEYSSQKKVSLYEDLKNGLPPQEGQFDMDRWKEANANGRPQVGTTRYTPHSIILEFIYPSLRDSASIISVTLESPERIVFMPVPRWVVESIWQGEIDGSYQFESDARALLAEFGELLEPEANQPYFGPRAAVRRE